MGEQEIAPVALAEAMRPDVFEVVSWAAPLALSPRPERLPAMDAPAMLDRLNGVPVLAPVADLASH
jgi:hypothetical protein